MTKSKRVEAPLFRDPIYDGASDPTVIWNREEGCYYMFYTQRRSTSVQVGYSSIHGSAIGVASSTDGTGWLYRGTLPGLDFEPGHNTFWAPEILYANGEYHMYVSYITGIPTNWNYGRKILHYTADNLWKWKYRGEIPLSSGRVIDACVYEVEPGTYKMWYKDEAHGSHTFSAVSRDLYHWEVLREEIADCAHEGPNVFEFGGVKWMITDFWNGLGVYRSDDFTNWVCCDKALLDVPGTRAGDGALGHHADVLVVNGEAYMFYFCHPYEQKKGEEFDGRHALTAIQAARLTTDGCGLYCNRNEEFEWRL